MLKRFSYLLVIVSILMLAMAIPGCIQVDDIDDTTGGNNNTNTGNNNTGNNNTGNNNTGNNNTTEAPNLTIVKTSISVHSQARIAAGDDIIAYGTGAMNGVAWIKPSAGDVTGRAIPEGDTFSAKAFAVAGKKIALVRNFQVYIYNTVDNTLRAISKDELTLDSPLPLGVYNVGHMQADGNYIAVMTDRDIDGKYFKVIDVSGDVPVVLSFTSENFGVNYLYQVAVDANAKQVMAANGSNFWVFDIAHPELDPINTTAGSTGTFQVTLRNSKILYANTGSNWMYMLDVGNGTNLDMDIHGHPVSVALNGGKFAFFQDDDVNGQNYRSVIGSADDAANGLAAVKGVQIDGSTDANGFVGYGQSAAITPDGSKIFIAGSEAIGAGEYLQLSIGGAFRVQKIIEEGDSWGFPASDVTCSANTVAFKGGSDQSTVVCYIRL